MAAIGGVITTTLLVASCATTVDPAPQPSSSGASPTGVTEAAALVDTYTGLVDSFRPTEPLGDASSLSGKKLMYIPAVAAVPYFATSFKGTQAAVADLGMSAELCDAQANPSSLSSCFTQVLTQGFAAVIIDSINPAIAIEGFNEVAATGIPVVLVNVTAPDGSPKNVTSFGADNVFAQTLASSAIIADSKGTATIIGVKVITTMGPNSGGTRAQPPSTKSSAPTAC